MGRRDEPVPIGDVVRRLMRGRLGRQYKQESAILEVWEEAVGKELAGRLVPLRLRAGVLWVGVESPALLYEVSQFRRGDIVEKLRSLLPGHEIEDVRFRLS